LVKSTMHTRFKVLIALVLMVVLPASMAGSDVIELTTKNFDEIVFKSKVPVLLEFYAPWCGHCKSLVPTYEEVATNLKGIALVAKIDATVEEGLAHRYGIRGFPTLKLYKPGSKAKDMQDYQGARSASALANFVTSHLSGNSILRLKESNAETLWSQQPTAVPRVILFSAKSEPNTLYKSLSMRFSNSLVFSMVQQNDPLCATYQVDTFPTVLVLTSQEAEPIKFQGKLTPDALLNFLSPLVQTTSETETKAENTNKQDTQPKPKPTVPAAAWKDAQDWNQVAQECGKAWCVLLINRQTEDLTSLKERMLTYYGKDGKFQFIEAKDAETANKFSIDDADSQWVVYNAKKSKYAKSAFDGSLPNSLMDRILSGDAKLTKME